MIKTACPTTLNLHYSGREIKIEGFGGRPPFGGRPGALGPMGPPLNPALLRLTSEVAARRSLRSVDSSTMTPSTRRSILGDRAFPVAAARAWNSLRPETTAASSLLTFQRESVCYLADMKLA